MRGTSPAKRPNTRAHGRWLRMPSPRSTATRLPELTSDWINVDHRRGAAFAAGEMTAYIHDLFDDVPDITCLRRSRASPEQPRSRRHPGGAWHLERGLPGRMAGDRDFHVRRRSAQPLRNFRRGRPRRRARTVRGAASADCAGWNIQCSSASSRTSRRATGTPWGRSSPTSITAMIAVGS